MRKAFREYNIKRPSVIIAFVILSTCQLSNYRKLAMNKYKADNFVPRQDESTNDEKEKGVVPVSEEKNETSVGSNEDTIDNDEEKNQTSAEKNKYNIHDDATSNETVEPTTPLDELLQHPEANSTSLQILLNSLKTDNPTHRYEDRIIDVNVEEERCKTFGYAYTDRKTRRRIFYGSNIADDSWHPIATHAAEAYGLYHTVALVEANITHTRTPRTMRFFPPESVNARAIKDIWGPTSHVFTEYYYDVGQKLDKRGDSYGLILEDLQRDLVLDRWIAQGMTVDDVGIIGDIDEFFSREFLLAASACDIPQFRPGQDCKAPKLAGLTLIFESAPDCIAKERRWFHPDMISGECVYGVGDTTKHPKAKRVMDVGLRFEGYGGTINDHEHLPENTTLFPLYKPSDIRMAIGAHLVTGNRREHSAFHLHNFFDTIALLRNKYKTYIHGYRGEERLEPLGQFHEDIDLAVRCMTNRTDYGLPTRREDRGFDSIDGMSQPLAFRSIEYRQAWFDEIRKDILEDEKKYGFFSDRGKSDDDDDDAKG